MTTWRLAALAVLVAADLAAAVDVPIPGKTAGVSARNPTRRSFSFRSAVTPAIAPPFPDPTAGASLRVFVSSGPGQCHAEIVLPAAFWTPISGDGAQKGWRYRDKTASAQGIRAITLSLRNAGGKIAIKGRGLFPCGLEAVQSAPMAVELRLADTRYCASFAVTRTNEIGRYRALASSAPAACLDGDVTVASLNVLHGIFCPGGTGGCRRQERMELVRDFVVARGCPDVLAFQEVFEIGPGNENADILATLLTNACPVPYVHAFHDDPFDDEMIFSRYPLLIDETLDLLGPLRNVLHVRVDHPVGPLDVYATHLASGSDSATSPCEGTFGPCPAACVAAGAATVRDCQAVQTAEHVEATHDVATAALLVGDFNDEPGSYVYQQFTGRGWIDTYLAAGNAECVPATGAGCTSGREDEALTDIEDPALNQDERIDFVFLVPAGGASLCAATTEPAGDPDGDGIATRLFADEPNPFAACGPSPAAVCWSSDHTGVQADVNCP
jgi:endonuclease/exonuclease/phosphatase family metal-dependent hydrolase